MNTGTGLIPLGNFKDMFDLEDLIIKKYTTQPNSLREGASHVTILTATLLLPTGTL